MTCSDTRTPQDTISLQPTVPSAVGCQVCVYVCACICAYYIYMCVHMCVCVCVHVFCFVLCACVCVHAHAYVCVCVCVCVQRMQLTWELGIVRGVSGVREGVPGVPGLLQLAVGHSEGGEWREGGGSGGFSWQEEGLPG